MKAWNIISGCTLIAMQVIGQDYTSSSIFAHNDYAQPNPFYNAYSLKVGYIEVDVFLKDDELFVAHQHNEIEKDRTLIRMYLSPLKKEIIKNNGWAFTDTTIQLKLMIDLKTDGLATLKKLISQVGSFPELIKAKGFEIFISGNVPSTDRWNEFPAYIHFDGRPGIQYTQEQLDRITLISTNFRAYSNWNGEGVIPEKELMRLDSLIQSVHTMGQKIRFWSIPDSEKGWQTLQQHQVDVIGTDHVADLIRMISSLTLRDKQK